MLFCVSSFSDNNVIVGCDLSHADTESQQPGDGAEETKIEAKRKWVALRPLCSPLSHHARLQELMCHGIAVSHPCLSATVWKASSGQAPDRVSLIYYLALLWQGEGSMDTE